MTGGIAGEQHIKVLKEKGKELTAYRRPFFPGIPAREGWGALTKTQGLKK